ncbi:MAG: iron-sulfur cluster assembly protein IscA, partial [Nitrosomonadaceae bacterium]|nr:iron-sulfur cluster assembly protein IscA [Nitrosomonadaceae bacterium]
MGISLSENAAKQILKKIAKRGKGIGLRVGIKKV